MIKPKAGDRYIFTRSDPYISQIHRKVGDIVEIHSVMETDRVEDKYHIYSDGCVFYLPKDLQFMKNTKDYGRNVIDILNEKLD
jgi:hypothetical protein